MKIVRVFSIFFGFVFVDQYKDSFLYLGGMHGYNVSNWLVSQVGVPGLWMITVNLTTLLTTIAAIAVTIILSMAYPVIKILHYDSVEVLGSDD